jgi:hypothetical protein
VSFEIYKPVDTINKCVSFEVSVAVIVQIMVLWRVTPCSVVSGY